MRLIKAWLTGLFYIIGGLSLLGSLTKCGDEKKPQPRVEIVSSGNCLLPGIHGEANYYKDRAGEEFCVMYVLKDGWSSIHKNSSSREWCNLNNYNLKGLQSTHKFLVNREWLVIPTWQEEPVCTVFQPYGQWKTLNEKVSRISHIETPILDSSKLSNQQDKFTVELILSVSAGDVNGLHKFNEKLMFEVNNYINKYRPNEPLVSIQIVERLGYLDFGETLCRGSGVVGDLDIICDEAMLKIWANSIKDVQGLSPERRREVYDTVAATIKSRVYLKSGSHTAPDLVREKEASALLAATTRLNLPKHTENRLLTLMNISEEQLQYIRNEGAVMGWFYQAVGLK